ncbi:hypothetical protein GQX74_005868 [Glossina fuscipes]|nr:hypothetical protein GQX74_005868 [Glossina fuscipes]
MKRPKDFCNNTAGIQDRRAMLVGLIGLTESAEETLDRARLKSSREERGDAQASSDNSNTVISPIIVLLINNSHNSNSNLKAASVYLSHPTTANQPSTHFHPHPQQHEQQLRQHQGRQQQQLPPLLQRGVTSDQ